MLFRIEKSVYGGDGLARTPEGEVNFVPFALPGELVRCGETRTKDHAFAVLEASQARVEPKCIHFGRCGGCQYQMASYAAQQEIKRSVLHEVLHREEVGELPPVRVWPSPEPWGYRNRVRFRVEKVQNGLRLGYSMRGTNVFLPIQMCPIADSKLWDAAVSVMKVAAEFPKVAEWLFAAQNIEISCDEVASKVQIHLLCTTKTPRDANTFSKLATALLNEGVPLVAFAASRLHPASGRSTDLLASWGAAGLTYRVGEDRFWLTPGSFFQVNRFLVPTMVEIVCGMRQGTLAWDLYAGVGLFSRRLSRQFETTVAVEANQAAVQELRRSFTKKGDLAIAETTFEYLRRSITQRERPDLIVLDPPRAGVGEEACRLLLTLKPSCIIYVSCDPTTLARDLRTLTAAIYQIAEIHMIDLFPQTYHLETVMVLERKDVQAQN